MKGKPLHIGIVGCGTSGLAAALFLAADGHDVTLLERFSAPKPLGAGILLQPTGLAVLSCLGLGETVLGSGAKVARLHGLTSRGRTIFDIRYDSLAKHYFGLGIHRGALFSLLHGAVLKRGIKITTDCDAAGSTISGESRTVTDATGAVRGSFDLVVDASGARSRLRGLGGALQYNKPYPYGAVWGVCTDDGQQFGQDILQQRYDGAGVMIGALPIGKRPEDGRQTLAFFWSLPANSYDAWRAGDFAGWRARVADYWPELAPYAAQFRGPDDLTFAQYSDAIMKKWDGERIVFIGDAAHCTSPQLGQGANLGLIDALVLAQSLRENPLSQALPAYTAARKNHTRFYQFASRWLTPFFQSDSRAAALLRDCTFGMMCRTPVVKTEMLRTLAGVKTGIFTRFDPGTLHRDYALRTSQPR